MKKIIYTSLIVLMSSCVSNSKKDWNFIVNPEVKNTDSNLVLDKQQLAYDIDQLLYTLTQVYSGSKFLPKGEMEVLIEDLKNINSPINLMNFCKQIATAFSKVSDNHIKADFEGKNCFDKPKKTKEIGDNFYQEKNDTPWKVQIRNKNKKKILLIAITSFPQNNSPKWNGFLEAVKTKYKSSDVIIIDMRGNGGGDDTYGYKLAEQLSETPNIKTPYNPRWKWNKPDSFQVFVNLFSDWERHLRTWFT